MAASLYTMPAKAQFKTLTTEIANSLKSHFRSAREHRARICLMAASIRLTHTETREGNTRELYSDAFNDWYAKNKLDAVFGQKANFTKYAQVGERVFNFIANQLDAPQTKRDELLERLPFSISALYEISTLYNAQDIESGLKIAGHESGWDELRLALTGSPSRSNINDPVSLASSNSKPLIHPHVTTTEIIGWKTRWRNPPQKKSRATKTTIPLAVIYVNGEVYDFDKKTGEKIGRVDLADVEKKLQAIRALFSPQDIADERFRIDDDLQWIEEGYRIREWSSSPSRAFDERPSRTVLERLPTGPDGIARKALPTKKKAAKKKAAKKPAFLKKKTAAKKTASKKRTATKKTSPAKKKIAAKKRLRA